MTDSKGAPVRKLHSGEGSCTRWSWAMIRRQLRNSWRWKSITCC